MNSSKFSILFLLSFQIFFVCCKKEGDPPVEIPDATFETPAISDVVMYEINPYAFSTTKNFQGIIDRLDSIKALGINTIWLMPIYPVGILNSFGSPYCVKDYLGINSQFGTLDDLKTLVNKAHEKNIAVILDWVANHTSWDNDWINNKSWYTQDGNGNIISPPGTNWNDVADLNYDNDTMRLEMIADMKYWIATADIDGYRCDAADFVPFDFWKQAIDSLNKSTSKNLILLAEGARDDHFTAGFQMNFAWSYLSAIKNIYKLDYNVSTLFSTNATEYLNVPAGDQKLRFTTNHDESNIATPISVFDGKDGAIAASVVTIFLAGVPLIYCGQEVGVSNTSTYNGTNTINWTQNSDMLQSYKQLLNFYSSSESARYGTLETFSDFDVAIFLKTLATEKILVLANLRNSNQTIIMPQELKGNWADALKDSSISISDSLQFSPYKYLVLKNQ